jgi:TfoX/Sxy family transcriptional regulator of competence genes
MPYDEGLAERMRTILKGTRGLEEKKMFGGVGFLVRGNMACGVHKDSLIVRVEPGRTAAALKQPHARPFDITGRPMQGWVMVSGKGCKSPRVLSKWVKESVAYARSLPPK